jgi:hypothetical protein
LCDDLEAALVVQLLLGQLVVLNIGKSLNRLEYAPQERSNAQGSDLGILDAHIGSLARVYKDNALHLLHVLFLLTSYLTFSKLDKLQVIEHLSLLVARPILVHILDSLLVALLDAVLSLLQVTLEQALIVLLHKCFLYIGILVVLVPHLD